MLSEGLRQTIARRCAMTMTLSIPSLEDRKPLPGGISLLSMTLLEAIFGSAMAAYKSGTLDELLRRHPLVARRLMRRFDLLLDDIQPSGAKFSTPGAAAVAVALRWLITRLRPDGGSGFSDISREAWLERTSWRPMLALMCHFGFAPVAEFRDRYRPRADEPPVDQLCGLWSIGPSTFYRYLEKGKRQLASVYFEAKELNPTQSLSVMEVVRLDAYDRLSLHDPESRALWHRRQANRALTSRRPVSALWHLFHLDHVNEFTQVLLRFRIEIAKAREADSLVEQLRELPLTAGQQLDLCLAEAAIWKIRNSEDRERRAYEQALHIAGLSGDKLMLGRAYGALGKHYEPRDMDRALACFEESAEFCRQSIAEDAPGANADALGEYVAALQKLAWFYVLRNDSRCRAVLERAETLRNSPGVAPETNAMLEQAWGEYWRRAGDLRRAAEYKHRALNIYERIGDRRQILSMYNNLSLVYGEAKDFAMAIDYGNRVISIAADTHVEPYILTSVLMNVGVAYFWQEIYEKAIEHYQLALEHSERANLRVNVNRAYYNLAEAYYKKFQMSRDKADELKGDAFAAAALKANPAESDAGHLEATRNLKAEILGPHEGFVHDRLLSEEVAAHTEEMTQIQRHRACLALPGQVDEHVRARLAIARAYLSISAKEREAALALVEKHGLSEQFSHDFEELRRAFDQELTRRQKVSDQWRKSIGELLTEEQRDRLLEQLLSAGSVSKSIYANLCGVGLATASKHLGLFSDRGLLVQTGKGPSTKYHLPM